MRVLIFKFKCVIVSICVCIYVCRCCQCVGTCVRVFAWEYILECVVLVNAWMPARINVYVCVCIHRGVHVRVCMYNCIYGCVNFLSSLCMYVCVWLHVQQFGSDCTIRTQ